MSAFQLGTHIPSFTLPSTTGEDYHYPSSKKQDNNWQLIIFFRGAWCPVCVADLKELEENKGFFDKHGVDLITIATDQLKNLSEMTSKEQLSFPVLSDEELKVLKDFDVYYHGEDSPYEDHGLHGEPAYFLVDETGSLLYQQRQTSPFGRPTATELRKIITYIKKNLK
ncbi:MULTISPECIES: peroxiredoxin [unclassified Exiguobacterium]|uniref:peroxiredoxin family protein n=1 Tax=unclassified Exiguobacterium TaxID=2644629 RepID=UPI000B594D08|nr:MULTISPECIES: peroxiredoxin family protein [unclassified Exiguobacterium]ASI35390.1 peroxiredoxin [Exiguobacterium sp. N4-1P]ASI37403.1 peroxiredoxin [Exiguobacterium sp. N4-1P]